MSEGDAPGPDSPEQQSRPFAPPGPAPTLGTPVPDPSGTWAMQPPPGQPGTWGTPPPGQPGTWGTPPPGQPGTWGMPPPGQPGIWGMPPRPRRTGKVHLIWLAIALLATIASGSVGFIIGKNSAQIGAVIKSAAAAAGARPCPGATVAPSVGSHLAGELLPVPAGATRPKGPYAHQVLSLDQFISELYPQDPAEKARMVGRCFEVAAQQSWTVPSGETVYVYLIQFGTNTDARSYALAGEQGFLADPLDKSHSSVSGVSDGILIQDPTLDKYGNTRSWLLGDQANVTIMIQIFVPAHLPASSVGPSLLRQQAARI